MISTDSQNAKRDQALVHLHNIIIITRPPGAEVYCAPIRATVHESSRAVASVRFAQSEAGSSTVGT